MPSEKGKEMVEELLALAKLSSLPNWAPLSNTVLPVSA